MQGENKAVDNQMERYKTRIKQDIQMLIEKGLLVEAHDLIMKYREIAGNDIELCSMESVLAIMQERFDDAIRILDAGLEIDGSNFDLLYNKAYVYQLCGQKHKASSLFEVAKKVAPTPELKEQIAQILRELALDLDTEPSISNLTSIIVLTYNNLDYTKLCIDSIRNYTDSEKYEIIVVDNKSIDGTAEWLKEQTDLRVIYNGDNLGFPKGCNQGIEIAKGDSILLLNNDTIVTPNWLSNLRSCLFSSQTIGAVGAVTNSCSNYQVIPCKYDTIEEMLQFAGDYNLSDEKQWEERLRLVGFCLLIKREVVDKIGLLDEIFTPGNFEDDDYSLRIRKAGYRLLLCKDTFIHHFGSASFGKETNKHNELLLTNKEKFKTKWGFDPYYIINIRRKVTAFLKEQKLESPHILEIGCAGGGNLLDIKSAIPDAKLFGLEPCEPCIVATDHFAEITNGGIDKLHLFPKGFFDSIILSNFDPAAYRENLRMIKDYLKDKGSLAITIPKKNENAVEAVEKQIKKTFKRFDCVAHKTSEGILLMCSGRMNNPYNSAKVISQSNVSLTSIIILGTKATHDIKDLIKTIRIYTKEKSYEIIVLEDRLSDDTICWLRQQNDVKIIISNRDQSLSSGFNQALSYTTGETIVFLDDVVVTPHWLDNLKRCLFSSQSIGAVGAVANSSTYYQTINAQYLNFKELTAFAESHNISDSNKWEERLKLERFCIAIKKSVIDQTGLFDENFWIGYDDFCFRIRKTGYRLILCRDTYIHNNLKFLPELQKHEADDDRKMEEKWGFNTRYSTLIRHEIIDLIDLSTNSPINVLEVGCACGGTLLQIKNYNRNASLYGIELNENAAKVANSFARVNAENIENKNLSFQKEFFDYIIFADVLEHLYDPARVLKNMRPYLKKGGKFVASIPNVMHYSVIRGLLNQRWTYEDCGILDRTHLRFFTLDSIQQMFNDSGYNLSEIKGTTLAENESDKQFVALLNDVNPQDLSEQLNVYQYLISANKRHSV